MIAIVALLIAVLVGLLITRFATMALVSTGMSRQYARFQARSAFTGVGFTTSEAESVVNHPVRRRVILLLMLVGNAGIATLIATLMLGFSQSDGGEVARRGLVLAVGLGVLWLFAASSWVDRHVRSVFVKVFGRLDSLRLRDYAGLLKVGSDYDVGELHVGADDWLADRPLTDTKLRDEGVVVLGIDRDGSYLGTPDGSMIIRPGDTLIVYGRVETLSGLGQRRTGPSGELAHVDGVVEQQHRRREQHADLEDPSGP